MPNGQIKALQVKDIDLIDKQENLLNRYIASLMLRLYLTSDLLKAEDVKMQVCTIFSKICAKFLLLKAKLVNSGTYFMLLTKSESVFADLTCFDGNFSLFPCLKF